MDTAAPYASMALKTVPLLAPEYGEAAMKLDETLGSVSMGLKAVPYVANTASSIATKVDNVLPGGRFSDLCSSRYKIEETTLKYDPNVIRVVGESLGGSVALELQKNR